MNNTDFLINQMNQIQNLANQGLYITEECYIPRTETQAMIISSIYGFFIVLTLLVPIWVFWITKD